jgi:hypothetical protein
VCWKHNWKECPLEVIELRKEIAKIARIAKIAEIEKQDLYPQRMQMTQRNLPRIDADERG